MNKILFCILSSSCTLELKQWRCDLALNVSFIICNMGFILKERSFLRRESLITTEKSGRVAFPENVLFQLCLCHPVSTPQPILHCIALCTI